MKASGALCIDQEGLREDALAEEASNNAITNPGLLKWDEATQGLLAELVAENAFKGSLVHSAPHIVCS